MKRFDPIIRQKGGHKTRDRALIEMYIILSHRTMRAPNEKNEVRKALKSNSAVLIRTWTIVGSCLLPSTNSSYVSLASLSLSMFLKILSTR